MTTFPKPIEHDPKLYVTQLTSLRGVACLVVLVGHVIQVVHYHYAPANSYGACVRALIAGGFNAEGAVLLFFVLSGCVLSLSLQNVSRFHAGTLLSFYLKRAFRLYPLLWFNVGLAMVSVAVARHLASTGIFANWLTRNLQTSFSAEHTLLSLTGLYTRYNGPMWSLRVELIYSALFPAIYLLVKNKRLRFGSIGILAIIAMLPIPSKFGAAFGISFALGALIPLLPSKSIRTHGWMALAALAALLYDRMALGALHPPDRVFDLIETTAAFFLVRYIYLSGRSHSFLSSYLVMWLGELSFSIYLLHLPIFLLIFTALQDFIGLSPLLDNPTLTQIGLSGLTAAATIFVSVFTYNLIELPLHNIGRRLGKRLADDRRNPRDAVRAEGDVGIKTITPVA